MSKKVKGYVKFHAMVLKMRESLKSGRYTYETLSTSPFFYWLQEVYGSGIYKCAKSDLKPILLMEKDPTIEYAADYYRQIVFTKNHKQNTRTNNPTICKDGMLFGNVSFPYGPDDDLERCIDVVKRNGYLVLKRM